jgi:hypothetical protein
MRCDERATNCQSGIILQAEVGASVFAIQS